MWTSFIFQASDLHIDFCPPDQLKQKPAVKDLVFGKTFTDHMLKIYYNDQTGWGKPRISPLQDIRLHPAAKVLHYSVEVRLIMIYMILMILRFLVVKTCIVLYIVLLFFSSLILFRFDCCYRYLEI